MKVEKKDFKFKTINNKMLINKIRNKKQNHY